MVEVFACDFDDFDLQVLRFFVFSDPFFFCCSSRNLERAHDVCFSAVVPEQLVCPEVCLELKARNPVGF